MNPALISLVKEMCAQRARRYVSAADILAVIERESGCNPVFSKTDALLKLNLRDAVNITKLSEDTLWQAMLIDSGPYKGQEAKWRCERAYWQWAKKVPYNFNDAERFLLSCSIGLGQKMTRWLVTGNSMSTWIALIRQFMASPRLQVLYIAGDLDRLMAATEGNKELAFSRYNAGNVQTPTDYGLIVAQRAKEIQEMLTLQDKQRQSERSKAYWQKRKGDNQCSSA